MIKRLIKQGIKKENRRGSALIISLLMITLLLFMAMIYAFDARSSARQAKSAADSTQARFAAKGGLSQVLSLITNELAWKEPDLNSYMNPAIRFNANGFSQVNGRMVLYTNSGASNKITDYLTEPYIFGNNDASVKALPNGVSAKWLKQTDKVAYNGGYQDRSLRSVGFVVVDYTGAMSPVYTGNGDRDGANVAEINGGYSKSMGTAINDAIGTMTDSHTSLSSLIRSNPTVFLDNSNKAKMLLYNPIVIADPEQYWVDINDDNIATDDELFDRIDITAIDHMTANASTLYDSLLGYDAAKNPSRNDANYFCPWLKSLNVTNAQCREIAAQFAVNMIDRVDTDDQDKDGGTIMHQVFADISGATNELTAYRKDPNTQAMQGQITQRVFGVENALGLSMISIHLKCSRSGDEIKFEVTAKTRLVNCMDYSDQTGEVDFDVKIDVVTTPKSGGAMNWSGNATGTITVDSRTVSDESAEVIGEKTVTVTTTGSMWRSSDYFQDWKLANVEITSLVVKDTTDGTRIVRKLPLFHDRTDISDNYFVQWNPLEPKENSDGSKIPEYYIGVISKDPHFADVDEKDNTLDGSNDFSTSWIIINKDTINKKTLQSHEADSKIKDLIDLAYQTGKYYYNNGKGNTKDITIGSTEEYYGNSDQPVLGGKFTRVGQLGALPSPHTQRRSLRFWAHTMYMNAGQTINPSVSGLFEEEMMTDKDFLLHCTIAEGRMDADLLDMFKATSEESTRGTVNINGSYSETFQAIFHDIVPDGTTAFSVDDAVNALLYINGTTTSKTGNINAATAKVDNTYPLKNRGDIHRLFTQIIKNKNPTYQNWEDNKIDEFIEKFIEFFSTRQNYYVVYVTGIATNNVNSGTEGNILAAHRIRAVVYRDVFKNKVKILRMDALED